MSMISTQVDELRELATRCDELQVGAVKAVTMPSDMGSILREAADTIWQLRDDLQRANAENEKFRELLADTLMQPRDYCKKYGIEYESWDSANAHLDARMRELGVEL